MNEQDQLEERLIDWELQRRQGNELTAEDLCKDSRELVPALTKLIEAFKATDWLEADDDSADDFLHLPDFSTTADRADETQLPKSSIALDQFCQRLVDAELMDAGQVEMHRQVHTATDTASFARQLVTGKQLTRFQATVLLEGRALPLVLDRYVLLDEIGAGGMGAVYKALHQQMDRVVALKILPKETVDSSDKVKRFQREVKAAAKLEHPNIVTAFDAHEAKGIHFLVMSYVSGSDLAAVVRKQGPLSAAKAVNYLAQAARGLEHAHQLGIVHRDIKPANLLLDKQETVKILDMGLARIENADPQQGRSVSQELTQDGMVIGTIAYLAPEQALDTRNADARSDIYSLGCTLYYLLTGRVMYPEDTMMKTIMAHREAAIPSLCDKRAGIPVEFDAVFQQMVAKQPADRFQSMADLLSALEALDVEDDEELQPVAAESEAFHPTETFFDTSRELIRPTLARAAAKPPNRRRAMNAGGVFGLAVLLAGFIIKWQTPAGMVILELDQPELIGAVVTIDGQKAITIKTGEDDEAIEITPDETRHELEVKLAGFKTFTREFTFETGNKQTIRVRLEPLEAPHSVAAATSGENGNLKLDGADEHVELSSVVHDKGQDEHKTLSLYEMLVSADWEWSEPERLGPIVNSDAYDVCPAVTLDGLSLFFASYRNGGHGKSDIWETTRATLDSPWAAPKNLSHAINSEWTESRQAISSDGLTLVFSSNRPAGNGQMTIWFSSRATRANAWETPTPFAHNTAHWSGDPFLASDDLALIFSDGRDLRICDRDDKGHPWRLPINMPSPINSTEFSEAHPWLSDDRRVILFCRSRDGNGDRAADPSNMFFSIRKTPEDDWAEPVPLNVNSSEHDLQPCYCPGENALYFASERNDPYCSLWMSKLVRRAKTSDAATPYNWPANQPAPAIAPFTPEEAKRHQEEWAKHLGVPVEMENSIGMKFRVIPPGEFMMGSSEEEIAKLLEEAQEDQVSDWYFERIPTEGPAHRVVLTTPFSVAALEVTRGQFRKFVEATGYQTDAEKDGRGGGGWVDQRWSQSSDFLWNTKLGFETEQTDDHPVVNVSWNDAVAFCQWLSSQEGVGNYRLPMEAEWEFACRAGGLGRFSCGDQSPVLSDYAWHSNLGGNNTKPCGQKSPNNFGIFDLHGNVWEWCHDRFGPYTAEGVIDPEGSLHGSRRILRGGAFFNPVAYTRSAARLYFQSDKRLADCGFRVVRTFENRPPDADPAPGDR